MAPTTITTKENNMKIPYWWVLLIPYALVALGMAMNETALYANGGHMPVLFPGGACVADPDDIVHSCMTHATHLKILCDWIVSSHAVSSLGDHLQDFGSEMETASIVAWAGLIFHKTFKKA
jgi:hypothetical protein